MKTLFIVLIIINYSSFTYAFSSKRVTQESKKQSLDKAAKKINKIDLAKTSPFYNGLKTALKLNSSIDQEALIKAFQFLDKNHKALNTDQLCFAKTNTKNRTKIRNLNCLLIADYSKAKTTPRLIYINPKTGENEIFLTAHGKGSNAPDERETGLKTIRYSNVSGSNMTSLGFYLSDFLITSKKNTFGPGPNNGLMLDGISCTNHNARQRQIVAHTAMYVPHLEKGKTPAVGNSEGCITFPSDRKDVLRKCEHGALVYAYDDNQKHLSTFKKK